MRPRGHHPCPAPDAEQVLLAEGVDALAIAYTGTTGTIDLLRGQEVAWTDNGGQARCTVYESMLNWQLETAADGQCLIVRKAGPTQQLDRPCAMLAQSAPATTQPPAAPPPALAIVPMPTEAPAIAAAPGQPPASVPFAGDLWAPQPGPNQLPAGLWLAEQGAPTDAGIVYVDIGIHCFSSASGASQALDYFSNVRRDQMLLGDAAIAQIGERSRAIIGQTSDGTEASVYVLSQGVVIRVSVMSVGVDPLAEAGWIARGIVARMG